MSRARRVQTAAVVLWGRPVGAITWDNQRRVGQFEYDAEFAAAPLPVSPVHMPVATFRLYQFPELNRRTFQGLPGMLADALPDRFGNMLINQWLSRRGRAVADFSPVERLCYMGRRAMGALEFAPSLLRAQKNASATPLEVTELVELADAIVRSKGYLSANFMDRRDEALETIFRVGTSAGGARAKAVIAFNPVTEEVRSGQLDMAPGFEAWLLKFDGVRDDQLATPAGFGRVEYAYHRMARAAGITMEDCRLLPDHAGRVHFMTRRFDRAAGNRRRHMQSLCGLAHLDFNEPGAHGYESAFAVMRTLAIGQDSIDQLYRRMVFNVLARNQDDHTRNISFLMSPAGVWDLAPAYDMTWSYNPDGEWTAQHQMAINGKRDGFELEDLMAAARAGGVKHARRIIGEVGDAVARWEEFADEASVPGDMAREIAATHRRGLM